MSAQNIINRLCASPRFGLIITIGAVFSFTLMLTSLRWVDGRIDFTEDKLHKLSHNSKEVLRQLDGKVAIRYYLSRDDNSLPYELRNYSERVRRMLERMVTASQGKLSLSILDPIADQKARSSAEVDEVVPINISENETFYFGLSFNGGNQKIAIPFLMLFREHLLEKDLIEAIYASSLSKKKSVTLAFEHLPLRGTKQFPSWFMGEELNRFYDFSVTDFQQPIPEADLAIVIHPINPSDEFSNSVEAHLAQGKNLIVMLDPGAQSLSMYGVPRDRTNNHSEWKRLIDLLGLSYSPEFIVVDKNLRTEVNRGNGLESVETALLVREKQINQNHAITSDLREIHFPYAGGLTRSPDGKHRYTTLISTSSEARLTHNEKICQVGGDEKEDPADKGPFALAILVEGVFMTKNPTSEQGGSSEKSSQVLVISDSDFVSDPFIGETPSFQGRRQLDERANNFTFFMRAVDVLTGSTAMANTRSRYIKSRPLTYILEQRQKVYNQYKEQIEEATEEVDFLEASLSTENLEREAEKIRPSEMQDFIEEVQKLEKRQASLVSKLKGLQHTMARKEALVQSRIKWFNVLGAPIFVTLVGAFVLFYRSKQVIS